MREIKFRAWDKQKKQMTILDSEYVSEALHYYENGTHELMQYTGLKDKNGKEIYEGDIVYRERGGKDHDWKKPGWTYLISWNNHGACFENKLTGNEIDKEDMLKVEIIGNIYENPELIK